MLYNCYANYKILVFNRTTKKNISFEHYVIISNTIICIFLIANVYFKYVIIISTVHFMHMIVIIFINKRLIKTYYTLQNASNSGMM